MAASAAATAHVRNPGAENAGISISFSHKEATQTLLQSHFLFYFDLPLSFQRIPGWDLLVESSLQAALSSVPQLPEGASSPGFICLLLLRPPICLGAAAG